MLIIHSLRFGTAPPPTTTPNAQLVFNVPAKSGFLFYFGAY